ncbi:hypothetical protein K458DRAFT_331718 [Lentithecium fluviatile CBS 122367]|uniref:Zn(2)-C6 fungal-type domain-containing protein n=1 Tax=Lentithecium fluviatile CBS 122367 TaxID=1168545 RepID=A0A6G1JEU9_9PLEO|nr:hypothetical protein K458DRAFT_331718 [Lentithecium fluviatile CBS 122367]
MEESLQRRVLRKGTHSCAECKRRKIRCFFDRNSAVACVQCQQRGTPCIGQDVVDVPVSKEWENDERLKRMEHMLEQITGKLFEQGTVAERREGVADPPRGTRIGSSEIREERRGLLVRGEGSTDEELSTRRQLPARSAVSQALVTIAADQTQFAFPKYADTCRVLHAAFPPQHDVNVFFEAAKATIYLQALCNPFIELFTNKNTLTSAMLAIIPSATSHPVLLAKKLLHLALCIQQLDRSFDLRQLEGRSDLRTAMNSYFELACGMVTCHEELLDSVEGLECLVCESIFLVSAGNLRRAMSSIRRAINVAQFMGFHRQGASKATLKQLDPNTRVNGEFTWKHISYLERYLSLLLGLPTSITCAKFGRPQGSPGISDTEWFERMQIDMCDQIIRRNQDRDYSPNSMMSIDANLNHMASHMSVSWWSPLDFQPSMSHQEMMFRMIIAQMQIIHYNMLTVLHVPFLLKIDTDEQQFDYSKETCLYASREVIGRFMTFRSFIPVVYCCRPVDFCVLTAAITLLLFYLSRSEQSSGFNLAHQHVTDLALVGRALDTLDELHRLNDDALSRETAKLTRRLMDLESHASRTSKTYTCGVVNEDSTQGQTDSGMDLLIPYFGCIRLESKPQQRSRHAEASSINRFSAMQGSIEPSQTTQLQRDFQQDQVQIPSSMYHSTSIPHEDQSRQIFDLPMPDIMAGVDDWAFQGVDTAFFDSLMSGTGNDLIAV